MSRSRGCEGRIAGLVILTLASLWLPRAATAQTSFGLYNTDSFTYDGLTFTVGGCTSVVSGACSSTSPMMKLVEGGTIGGANLILESASGPLSAATGSPGFDDTLSYTLTVTKGAGSTGKTTVTSSSLAIVGTSTTTGGTASSSYLSDLGAGATFSSGYGASSLSVNASSGNTSRVSNFASSPLTSAGGSFVVTDTVSINTTGSNTGYTLTLGSVKQTFSKAPEPLSIGVFLVGLAGLGATRRRWTRRTRA